jgi:hypothetical protein
MFGNSGEFCRNVHMVDIGGLRLTICQAEHLNTVRHMSILSTLEHWVNQFCKMGNLIESEAH